MTKIGIIADVHSNLYALEAVLDRFKHEHVDGVICCGDIIGTGPHPDEIVKAVMEIPNMLACVSGNHDRYLTEGFSEEKMSPQEAAYHRWEHGRISRESRDFLAHLPYSVTLSVMGKAIYVTHYAMDANNWYVAPKQYDYSHLCDIFGDVDADIIIFGHEHKGCVINGDKWHINPGSLGCPGRDKNIARAGLLRVGENDVIYSEMRIAYDVAKTLEDIENLNFPAMDEIKRIFYGSK